MISCRSWQPPIDFNEVAFHSYLWEPLLGFLHLLRVRVHSQVWMHSKCWLSSMGCKQAVFLPFFITPVGPLKQYNWFFINLLSKLLLAMVTWLPPPCTMHIQCTYNIGLIIALYYAWCCKGTTHRPKFWKKSTVQKLLELWVRKVMRSPPVPPRLVVSKLRPDASFACLYQALGYFAHWYEELFFPLDSNDKELFRLWHQWWGTIPPLTPKIGHYSSHWHHR